ncbi:MAG: type II toxin-antitoxin system VapC family toxin, partial [Dehalococcoidia bacterium]|nr:type II toxin-antitoxin system VapC family toxin [Dehalococcoidia bacterium]
FLRESPIVVDSEAMAAALGPVRAIGRETGVSAYDATYLELAARLGIPLATQDKRLEAAAARLGIPLFA